ncbi:DUF4382 domain-containing protein [Natrinema salsiterrestre]|uniref:DUF4382 domain-containing protein n=1 Tax=Natrinema salsiterrestre TaxID=2950540 RepID=A0A9Q4Q0X4_9EURY|nr:DUF4382 domain-containing protein [Natrinema salsiterrestre]MDF9747165.1 DUF4382 domain-containing protein [Natrinema salsiterrestre]
MDSIDGVDRRDYLKLAGGAVAGSTAGLSGCLGGNEGGEAGTGTLGTQITDQPGDIADFESCVVTVQGIWIKPTTEDDSDDEDDGSADEENATENDSETDEQDESNVDEGDGREYHEFDEPQEADLVDLQGENTQLVDERELTVREYEYLQLDVTGVTGELKEGGEAEVSTPGNAPLQFKERFEIREDQRTTFVGDFTPVRQGQRDRYLLQPVAKGTRVIYEDSDSDENSTENESEDDM